MIVIIDVFLTLVCAVILVPSVVLFLEAVAALLGRGSHGLSGPDASSHGPVAVLVPAHNEGQGMAATLINVSQQLRAQDVLCVVADNCSDDTAEVAAAHGAVVFVRHDATRRGKGYALDFGLKALAARAPDVVIIIDADCRLTDGSLQRLAAKAAAAGRPVQALDLMKAPEGEAARFAVASFAWIVRNQVRPLGLANLGLPCQLMGTGMAFPWAVISKVELASGNVVEDLELGVKLARAGLPPRFFPDACVESEFPVTDEGVIKQRQRWEQGSLAILAGSFKTAGQAIRMGNLPLLAMAVDTMVPPLTLHAAAAIGAVLITGALFLLGGLSAAAPSLALCALALFMAAMLISWAAFGRHVLPLSLWPRMLQFALAKLKIYRGFRPKGTREWVRSDRSKGG